MVLGVELIIRTKNPRTGQFEDATWSQSGLGMLVKFPSDPTTSYLGNAMDDVGGWEFERADATSPTSPQR